MDEDDIDMPAAASPDRAAAAAALAAPAAKQNPSTLRFYGDEFVFDTVSGMFYRVSPTASFVLRSLEAGAPIDELATLLQERYGVDRATALRDIELLLNELAALEPLGQLRR